PYCTALKISGYTNLFTPSNKTTDELFKLHWPSSGNFGKRPTWEKWEPFLRGNVPNYKLGGCYALFEGVSLIYIGKGVGKVRGSTLSHGISRRLSSHVLRIDKYEKDYHWCKLIDKWNGITDIYTIGFSNESEHLAHALENFLIRKLSPPKNSNL
ncbi:hypothetical protein, partial [Methylobacter sp.]|uniref:hypothetical protein n=1 Tax=Methylobacter sp. TaxID=2051955 RepID=UPI00248938E8